MHDCVLRGGHVAKGTSICDSIMTTKNSSFTHSLAVVRPGEVPLRLHRVVLCIVRRDCKRKPIKPLPAAFQVQSIIELRSDA
jgi:hypothetical protein